MLQFLIALVLYERPYVPSEGAVIWASDKTTRVAPPRVLTPRSSRLARWLARVTA